MNQLPTYYDNASTTPVDPRVKEAMLPYFDEIFGNASSGHIYGKEANNGIEMATQRVRHLIGTDKIYYTSGATEAINWALKGFLEENPEKGNHIITVKTEHKAVLETCNYLENKGYDVTYLDVDRNGLINLEDLESAINENTALITVMYVNNETGIIQDVAAIGKIADKHDVTFFCDATQAIGKINIDMYDQHIDMLCISAHKFGGPKGIGALCLGHKKPKITPLIHGGGQQNEMRGGTYNTPLIVGFGMACLIAQEELEEKRKSLYSKRAKIIDQFESNNWGTPLFNKELCSPHIISFQVNEKADLFLIKHREEFVASTGSACNSSIIETSHVIKACFGDRNDVVRISIN